MMKTMNSTSLSHARRQMRELVHQYVAHTSTFMGGAPLVRGTLNWHTRASGRYPGITRGTGGRVIGRRVRLEHVAWLEPLLARHKSFRQAELHLRRLHTRILALAEQMRLARLYDYEPQAAAQQYLVKVEQEQAQNE